MVAKEVAVPLEDFNALASSLAVGVVDVRACLIVSRDGLVLGAHPAQTEATAAPAWVRFAQIGDPERGFAQFGTETWCYVRRGPYAGFAVVGPRARPGLVIDHMDQVLLAAEEARSRHVGPRGNEPTAVAPVSRARSHLYPIFPERDSVVIDAPTPQAAAYLGGEPGVLPPVPVQDGEAAERGSQPARGPTSEAVPEHGPPGHEEETEQDDDVDRFSLAREFGQLLQHREDGADG
jgi:hypothetical protein